MRSILLVALGVLMLSLQGCGFHLRGGLQDASSIPYTFLQGATGGVARELGNLDKFTADPAKAQVTLNILRESFDRRVLSVGTGGRVSEYEVIYTVSFAAQDQAGKSLIEPQTITLTRDYQFNKAQVLAEDQQEAALRRDMVRDAAQQIVRRLQALK